MWNTKQWLRLDYFFFLFFLSQRLSYNWAGMKEGTSCQVLFTQVKFITSSLAVVNGEATCIKIDLVSIYWTCSIARLSTSFLLDLHKIFVKCNVYTGQGTWRKLLTYLTCLSTWLVWNSLTTGTLFHSSSVVGQTLWQKNK